MSDHPPMPSLPGPPLPAPISIRNIIIDQSSGSSSLLSFSSSSSSSSPGGPSRHAAAAPTVAPTTSPKPDEHPCLAVLKTKTKGTKTLPERKKMLRELLHQGGGIGEQSILQAFLKNALGADIDTEAQALFTALQRSLPLGGKDYGYLLANSAQDICSLDSLVSRVPTTHHSNNSMPLELKTFVAYMDEVQTLAIQHRNKEKAKRKVGTQSASEPPKQNSIKLPLRGSNCFDAIPCAACKHQYVFIEGDEDAIWQENLQHKEEYSIVKADYKKDRRSTRTKGQLAKPPKHQSAELICMCIKMKCSGRADGKGCDNCVEAVKNNKKNGGSGNPLYEQGRSACEVCNCQCTVVYKRSDTLKLSTQVLDEKEQQKNTSNDPGK